MHYIEVAPLKIIRQDAATFTYHTDTAVEVGSFVDIQVGSRIMLGLVVARTKRPTYNTKPIPRTHDIPPLPLPLLRTALWMSEYYATHLAQTLSTILPAGVTSKRRSSASDTSVHFRKRTHFLLNKSQRQAVESLIAKPNSTFVLHGVTGSGKTAVYIEYVRTLLSNERSVIVLVPEIALTPQLVAEFQLHFPNVILTHSRQTEAKRHQIWLQVARSTSPHVIIGPRSALFMPVRSLGAIIIDEAHEPSFKQEQSPRYSALRVASILTRQHNATLVQGSATPLVSEYYLAQRAKDAILSLPERAAMNMKPAELTTVDMTKKLNFTQHRFFSDTLLSHLRAATNAGKQALIYHNRRGSAMTTLCHNCGWSAECTRCFVPLTLHADEHLLRCHICGSSERVPTSCPSCASTEILHKGIGTKLIESELSKLFPKARIARFDGDTRDNSVDKRYQQLYDGEIDIIIGTQVVAKGLDLPHLAMVGVIQADAGLSLPDYTSSERTFQLIAQVVGRVGRTTHETQLVIQSYQPSHPAVQLGISQDYNAFYEHTLAERRKAGFPPFCHLLQLTCTYKTEAAVIRNAQALSEKIRNEFPNVTVLGPTPAFYERQRDTYRWQLTIKATSRVHLLAILKNIPKTHWQANLDPYSLL